MIAYMCPSFRALRQNALSNRKSSHSGNLTCNVVNEKQLLYGVTAAPSKALYPILNSTLQVVKHPMYNNMNN